MKTKFNAVMHVTVNQPKEIAELATRVGTDMDENDDVYTAPSPPLADLATENGKLLTLNGQAKGNSLKKAERDAQAIKVFGMLSKELVQLLIFSLPALVLGRLAASNLGGWRWRRGRESFHGRWLDLPLRE